MLLFLAAILLAAEPVFAQTGASTFKAGSPSDWVEWLAPEPKSEGKGDLNPGGQTLVLVDTQANVAKAEVFVRAVKEITTEAGVQTGANLQFTWDPSYQELMLHDISIHRGAERLDRLELSKFKIIQQETDLNRQIYNGTLSAVRFLEDVRVGDRIEYAFTVRGTNPSMKGRYCDSFFLGSTSPIQHRRVRVLWPAERELHFRTHGTSMEPKERFCDGLKECVWEMRQAPAVTPEDQVPSWFPAYPWLQASEFADWSQVAAWAADLYATTNQDAPELKELITKLQHSEATTEQRIQAALEFAQNDIRYLGIEFGSSSYHPTDPGTVLRQRFGDCKDKAFLLCTLLRALGCEATPVLVATGLRHTLPDYLPAPHDFDHAIVRVATEDATYWLDPTRTYQRGPISQRHLPDYSLGLLVRAGETNLTPIPASVVDAPESITSEAFDVRGQKAPAELRVTSTYRGLDAEWMRVVLVSEGRERLAKSYLNDYAQRYPGITGTAPLLVEDSTNSDTLVIQHAYSISNFWELSADKQRYACQFYPLGIHTWIAKPSAAVRSMPMELSFPRRRIVRSQINLPRQFRLTNLTNTVAGPGAKLRIQRNYRGQTVWLEYEYSPLTNFISAELAAEHLRSLDRMETEIGYSLNWQSMDGVGSASQFNWPIFFLAAVYATIFAAGASLLFRRHCQPAPEVAPATPPMLAPELTGLGGWLILIGFSLVLSPIRLAVGMLNHLGSFALWTWHSLTKVGGVGYNPLWAPTLTFELLGDITILIMSGFVLTLFFQRRRAFPRWFIALLLTNAVFVIADSTAMRLLSSSSPTASKNLSTNLASVVVGCGIWLPYVLRSRRVKNTFVR